MSIREIMLETGSYQPGEYLSGEGNYFKHIIFSYDVSGDRYKVDRRIDRAIEADNKLQKIECVNTTLYWQAGIDSDQATAEELDVRIKQILKEKIKEIFVDENDLSYEEATVFCMVGNIRGYAFRVDV